MFELINQLVESLAIQEEAILISKMKKVVSFSSKEEAMNLLESKVIEIVCNSHKVDTFEGIDVYTIINTLTNKKVTFRIKKTIDLNDFSFKLEVM